METHCDDEWEEMMVLLSSLIFMKAPVFWHFFFSFSKIGGEMSIERGPRPLNK